MSLRPGGPASSPTGTRWGFVSQPSQLWDWIAAAAGPEAAGRSRFLVKVNWYSPHPANFTGPFALDFVLKALPGPATVVESHSAGRTDGSRMLGPGEAVGEAREWLREQQRAFLRDTGLETVLARHGASYVNVTEEVWSGRTVDAGVVRSAVQSRFGGQPACAGASSAAGGAGEAPAPAPGGSRAGASDAAPGRSGPAGVSAAFPAGTSGCRAPSSV
ncbi:MAG: hypothetical protein K6T75_05720 [Acetobacteraceae bacterium]|nr:hypothetical protein [Acetobacteraceae bacterium]